MLYSRIWCKIIYFFHFAQRLTGNPDTSFDTIVNLELTPSEAPSKFKSAVVFSHIKKILLYKED